MAQTLGELQAVARSSPPERTSQPTRRTFGLADIERGWLVSDCDDEPVGTIAAVGPTVLAVSRGLLRTKLYVPPSAIGVVSEGLVRLNLPRAWIEVQGWDRKGARKGR